MGTPVTNANENVIWSAICMKKGTVPDAIVGETLPHSVAAWFQKNGRKAEIIESPNTNGGLNPLTTQYPALKMLYDIYHAGANSAAVKIASADPSNAHIAKGERLFLVSKLDGQDATHYVLARRDGGQSWIMNPDPGSDDQMDVPAVGAQFSTYGGKRKYVFTGIAVQVS